MTTPRNRQPIPESHKVHSRLGGPRSPTIDTKEESHKSCTQHERGRDFDN